MVLQIAVTKLFAIGEMPKTPLSFALVHTTGRLVLAPGCELRVGPSKRCAAASPIKPRVFFGSWWLLAAHSIGCY